MAGKNNYEEENFHPKDRQRQLLQNSSTYLITLTNRLHISDDYINSMNYLSSLHQLNVLYIPMHLWYRD
jgi:hypothetical protein